MNILNSHRGIVSAQLLCQLAQEEGMALAEVLKGSGISIATLGNAYSRILGRQEIALMHNLAAHVPDLTGLGIRLGQRYRLANYGVFGFGLSSSATLQQAAQFGLRFAGLSYAFSRFELEITPARVRVYFYAETLPSVLRPLVIERDVSALVSLVHEIINEKQVCTQVSFVHGAECEIAPKIEHFGVAPQFEAKVNMVEMDLALFTRSLPQANAKTHRDCVLECEALLAELQQRQGWPDKVRHAIGISPTLDVCMEDIAQHFFVSSRTLRRYLDVHGQSFRGLLDEVREARAKELLTSGEHSLKEIAEQIGYQEPASLVHAFKRWTGTTPGRWREENM